MMKSIGVSLLAAVFALASTGALAAAVLAGGTVASDVAETQTHQDQKGKKLAKKQMRNKTGVGTKNKDAF